MRIVLDTNVLIAAFITSGVCNDLFEHCCQHHRLITSDFILKEFSRHMANKFQYDVSDVDEAVSLIKSQMEVVMPIDLEAAICRDPDDDNVLGTAIAGNASCIITGDKDLLVIKKFRKIDIIRPSEFSGYEAVKTG